MRTKGIDLVVLGCLVLSIDAQESRPSTEIRSEIRKVTVYLDRALVTRSVEAVMKRGESEVTIRDLPALLLDESIRAHVRGAKLLSTEVKRYSITKEQVPHEEVKRLQAEIQGLEQKIEEFDDQIAALAAEKDFILSLKAAKAEDILKINPKDWKEVARFIRENLDQNALTVREVQGKRQILQEKRSVLQDDLSRLSPVQVLDRKMVTVMMDAAVDGKAEIELSYIVPACFWSPHYDAHVEYAKEDESIELTYSGMVVQNTGEDWTHAEIELSTSQPARSNDVPELRPVLVSIHGLNEKLSPSAYLEWQQEFRRNFQSQKRISIENRVRLGQLKGQSEIERCGQQLDAMATNIENIVLATLTQHVPFHTFRLEKRETIPSDGASHKVTLATAKYPARFERIAVPRAGPYCYVKGTLRNDKDFPLLPGTLNLMVRNNFIGTSTVKAIAPNESFELSVGMEDGVKLARKLEEKREEQGTLRKVYYQYRMTLTNLKNERVKLTVQDLVPISRESDVEVIVMEGTTPYQSLDKEGKIQWALELDKGQSSEIVLKYRIFYPSDKVIQGLE